MPGAFIFRNVRDDGSITINCVVSGDLAGWIRKLIYHLFNGIQYRRVNNDCVDCHTDRPFVEVAGWVKLNMDSSM
jgi:hypothetical protein